MSKDERDPLPPSYAPASGARRPSGGPARAVGPDGAAEPDRQTPPRPRRQPGGSAAQADGGTRQRAGADKRPNAPQRTSIRRDAAGDPLPPSYAPAGPRRAPAPRQAPRTAPRQGAATQRYWPGEEPAHPGAPGSTATATRRPARRRRPIVVVLVLLLVLLVAWPVGLLLWADGKIQHTEALSGTPGTPGTTYLLAGSDSRADGAVADPTEGQRSDTIMVMHVPEDGATSLVSLPRDTLVEIPGNGLNKLNASFSLGGPPLLVQTVEGLTGLTVDHYVEIGMGGVQNVVDAVGGVELCLDRDVQDELSGLSWVAGCHEADGPTALAFARMRYSDPTGDIGRSERQRQVVAAVVSKAADPATLVNPGKQIDLVGAGVGALVTDTETGIVDLARMALAFRAATGEAGIIGTPPIADFDYRPGGVGSTVLLDEAQAPMFFQRMRDGQLTASDVATP